MPPGMWSLFFLSSRKPNHVPKFRRLGCNTPWRFCRIRGVVSLNLYLVPSKDAILNLACSCARKVFKIHNLTDIDATLTEPTACAIHGVERLQAPPGAEVLILGAGPTGRPSSLSLPSFAPENNIM